MKFKFKPQTCLLVAGMVATAYAQCFTQVASGTAVCFYSGDTVDDIHWQSLATATPNNAAVVATSDWVKGKQTGTVQNGKNHLNAYSTGGAGYGSHTPTTGADTPLYCYGPAKFVGPGGNETVAYWENNSADNSGPGTIGLTGPKNGGTWGVTSGSTCP